MTTQDGPYVLSGRKVTSDVKPVVVSIPDVHTSDKWQVKLDRVDDVVRTIRVTCPCGEHLRIECDYTS